MKTILIIIALTISSSASAIKSNSCYEKLINKIKSAEEKFFKSSTNIEMNSKVFLSNYEIFNKRIEIAKEYANYYCDRDDHLSDFKKIMRKRLQKTFPKDNLECFKKELKELKSSSKIYSNGCVSKYVKNAVKDFKTKINEFHLQICNFEHYFPERYFVQQNLELAVKVNLDQGTAEYKEINKNHHESKYKIFENVLRCAFEVLNIEFD